MNPLRRYFSPLVRALGAGAILATAGCADLFVVKQKIMIDAISAPDAPKPAGQSYRLVARKTVVSAQQAQVPVIKACVDAALIRWGMYEAPPNVPSDIFIELNYGMDTTSRVDASLRESFLQLSARANTAHTVDLAKEEELWDVRVAVRGLAGRLESAMPMLSTVAAKYIATDTRVETTLEIADNSPEVKATRETAMKALGRLPPPAATATSSAAPATVK